MIGIIGDIHGCYHTLVTLVDKVKEKYPGIDLYCVGDIVDRGNFSHLVVEYIASQGIKTALGNHDNLFCHAFFNPGNQWAVIWEMNGCQKTMAYYSQKCMLNLSELFLYSMFVKAVLLLTRESPGTILVILKTFYTMRILSGVIF